MKKKSFIAAALIVAMAITAVSGCGSQSTGTGTSAAKADSTSAAKAGTTAAVKAASTAAASGDLQAEKGAEVEVAYWEGSSSDKAAWDQAFENLKKDHPEIKVKPQTYPSASFRDMIDTRIAGNDWPDIIRYNYQRLGKFKDKDVMLDLTPYMDPNDLKDIVPAYLSACQYNGKLVALPHHTDVIAMFYNKKMFKDAGIEVPATIDKAWSWEELTENAKKLKEANKLDYAFAGIWEKSSGYRYLPFVYMNGGAMLSDDQKTVTMDSPKVLEAIKLYEGWRKENLISNTAFTGDMVANTMFVAGKLAFTFSGSWHCAYMQENMPDKENWGVTYMPQRNGKTGSDMGGNGLFGYKGTKYPKATAIVLKYLTSAEQMKAFCETGNFIPVRQSLLDKGLNFKNFPDEMKIFMEIAKTVDSKMAADETSVKFQNLNTIFNEAMDPMVVDGSQTAEQVVKTCQEKMTEELKN